MKITATLVLQTLSTKQTAQFLRFGRGVNLLALLPVFWLISCDPAIQYSGNPVIEGWYADPEVAVFADRYWIYPTYSARFENQVFMDAFSSPDLVNWEKHPRIIDTAAISWAREAMWAPCAIENNGRYYLFFAANDIQRPESPWYNPESDDPKEVGGIGVGVATAPEGPYQDYLGKPLIGEVYHQAQPIDQFVFQDQDQQWYIIYGGWGHCNIAQLKSDFSSLEPFENGELTREITPEGYVEGPVMFIRNERYYFMWSEGSWTDNTYQVAYGYADSPFGPFTRKGTILSSDPDVATGAGHHSILHPEGTDDWYIVYHRRPIPNQDRDHRVVCIDRMYFDEQGEIIPIVMTLEGVQGRPLSR